MNIDWLKGLIKNNPVLSLAIPSILSGASFFGNLFMALSDGNLDGNEIHQLMGSADGLQMIILMLVILALKKSKTD